MSAPRRWGGVDGALEKDVESGLEIWEPLFKSSNVLAYLSDLFVEE